MRHSENLGRISALHASSTKMRSAMQLRYTTDAIGIFLDYSKNRITDDTLSYWCNSPTSGSERPHRRHVRAKDHVTEDRAVLHVHCARRRVIDPRRWRDVVPASCRAGQDVHLLRKVRSGAWRAKPASASQHRHIGIGGSDLGRSWPTSAQVLQPADLTFRSSRTSTARFRRSRTDLNADETLFLVAPRPHHPRDDDQRARSPRLGSEGSRRRRIRHRKTLRRYSTNAKEVATFRHRHSKQCSAFGTG